MDSVNEPPNGIWATVSKIRVYVYKYVIIRIMMIIPCYCVIHTTVKANGILKRGSSLCKLSSRLLFKDCKSNFISVSR